MLNVLKNKFANFASYMLGLDEKLKNAKNDAERVKWLTQINEAQRKRIEELEEQLKDKVETESILSSSGSSSESLNSQKQRERNNILKHIQKDRTSTAPYRKLLTYFDENERLRQENEQKDLMIKELGEIDLDDIEKEIDELTMASGKRQGKASELLTQIEQVSQKLKK